MLRGISSTCPFELAKQCVISAFDTNYLMSTDEVMANILHLAQNMEEELPCSDLPSSLDSVTPISALVAVGHGSHGVRGHVNRGGRSGRGLPNKCSACGSLDHMLSSCTSSDDPVVKWTMAKRKTIIKKYGTPGGNAPAHAALLSDVLHDDPRMDFPLSTCTLSRSALANMMTQT
jgi:hypothetical protein